MFLRGLFTVTALLLSICGIAQTKVIPLYAEQPNGVSLTVFNPDLLASPTGTSVILYNTNDKDRMDSSIITSLTKKGGTAFVLKNKQAAINQGDISKAFEYLQKNASSLQISSDKTGIIILNSPGSLISNFSKAAFIGIIDPATLPKITSQTTIPLLIDASDDKNGDVIKVYSSWVKGGRKAEIHLHQQNVQDSTKTAEVINWIGSLGFMKPLSNEKTEAQKNSENWANLRKYYDDLLHKDWAWITRYEADNEKMPIPVAGEKRVVFLGNSITEGWIKNDPDFFKNNHYFNRGIGGQTTPQMLVRFREDVINLHPQIVIILAGINDIAENTGPSKIENVAGNLFSMAELARVNGIEVILCSVLPALSFPWHPGINPVESIVKLNTLLKNYANKNNVGYVDYYSAMADENKGIKKGLAIDGVHPTPEGYKIMEPLAKAAIDKVLSK
jgi:lysophospholipase L1-like esterase